MATGGHLSRYVACASDEYFEFTCSPCKQESKFMEAEVFCEDCLEYLCRQCLKFHNKFEKMKAHRMVDKDGMKAQGHRKPLSAPTETCEKHHGRLLDTYCRDHDELCCMTCVSLNHITCKGRVYLADAAEGISSSKAMKTFTDTLGGLKVKLARLEKEKGDALEESNKEATKAKDKVLKTHHLIIDHLAKLVEASLAEIEERYTEQKSAMKNDVKMVTEMISEIQDIEENIDPSKEKNETKVFVNMKRHAVSLDSFNDDLARLQNANTDKWEFVVTQQVLDITEQVASFGQLENDKMRLTSLQDLPPRRPKSDEEKLQDLFQAIFSGDVEKVNSILRTDPQLVLMDLQGKFAIHLACREGKIDVVETLFKNSSKEVLLEMPDPEKNTPLLAAVKGEKSEMVKFLVEQGANKDAADQSDRTAVHMAATSNNVAMLGLLQALQFDINKKDMLNQSAIFDAIVSDNEEIIAVVLSWPEVEVRYQDSIGFTPFSIACHRGNLDAICRILEIAPDELNNPKQDGCTGLHMAALNNHKAVVDFLLQQDGIAIDAVNKGENHTPLHIACHEGYLDIVKLLIEKGANKMAVDCSRKTPLHLCCEVSPEKVNEPEKSDANVLKMVEYLLKSGVPYNLKDKADKVAEDYIKPSAKKAFQELVAKWGQERDAEVSDPPRDNAASSGNDLMTGSVNLPRNPTPEPAKMSQSTGAPRQTMEPTPRITDMQDGDSLPRGRGKANIPEKGPKDAEADKDPELCESCKEEPVRYKMEPCGCYLCAECIPRKKAKKKSCAMCAEAVAEVTELSTDGDSLPRGRGKANIPEKGPKDAEADKDPELCESCEEEPVRYKMEPCGCYLCAECIPRKKAKKKSCAMCAEAVAEVTELSTDGDSLPRGRGKANIPEKGPKDAEADKDPELCESCEEEPVRYKMEPCGCYLCAECIPRKKAKKKSCAMCAEAVAEVTELR